MNEVVAATGSPSQDLAINDLTGIERSRDRSDEQLLAAARLDPQAFGCFYARRVDVVLAFFLRRTGDREVAADLTAETFAAALLAVRRYHPERGTALGWLYAIAQRRLVDSLRRGRVQDRARRRLHLEPLLFSDEDLERVEERAASAAGDSALALLEQLSREQREAVRGRVIDEADYEELGRRLGCSEQVARKRVSRGLTALRTKMREV
jgi:RNA polymerase sigma-70 factor (ECF subfamily)